MNYYNTTQESGQTLLMFTELNKVSSMEVLSIFETYSDKSFTPYEIGDLMKGRMLQSSIKRAITDLTALGYLVKTGEKVIERYGRSNYKWKLNLNK